MRNSTGGDIRHKKLSLWEAVSMAIGTMIGASIFSVFGVGVAIAGQNLPEAFLLSGMFALLVAYSYAKLSSEITSNAGPIAFIHKAIGDNLATGTLSVLLWCSYVVSISLFAKGFVGYALPLIHINATPFAIGMTTVIIISFFMALNFFGSKAVGKAELFIVLVKLSILGIFIVMGFLTINKSLIAPSLGERHLAGTLYASVVFFLSYMGFGIITNASEHIENPRRNVPLGIYISIIIVIFVYTFVALAAVGSLPLNELINAKENVLAVAAKPFLGNFGFMLISLGALFSISSAMNATIYGGANVAYSLAKDGELPVFFERKIWFKSTEGLYITAATGLIFALLFDVEGIASITSAVFIVIYLFVIFSHYRLVNEVGGNKKLILLNFAVILAVLLVLMYYQWQAQKHVFYGTIITFLGAMSVEFLYRRITERRLFKIR